jgi:transposase
MLTTMTEEDWAIAVQVFRASRPRRGDKGRDDRKFLEALHYFVVHNITWRALPAHFGPWNSVWKRFWRRRRSSIVGQGVRACTKSSQPVAVRHCRCHLRNPLQAKRLNKNKLDQGTMKGAPQSDDPKLDRVREAVRRYANRGVVNIDDENVEYIDRAVDRTAYDSLQDRYGYRKGYDAANYDPPKPKGIGLGGQHWLAGDGVVR